MNKQNKKTLGFFFKCLMFSLSGAVLLILFSAFQKTLSGYPLIPNGFFVPFIAGSIFGLVLGIWNHRLQKKQKELKKQILRAEESDRLKTKFLENFSHEIRTPINGIVGFVPLLRKNLGNPEKTENYLNIIQSSSIQLLDYINQLVDISKLDAKLVEVKLEPVNLNAILTEQFEFFKKKLLADKREELLVLLEKPLPDEFCSIISDPRLIRKLLSVLLNNALKYTLKGEVFFGYKIDGTNLVFFVKDTGVGIEETEYSNLFKRFYQTDHPINETSGGTGIGLAIAKEITSLLKGEIWLISIPDAGTTFYVKLPYKCA